MTPAKAYLSGGRPGEPVDQTFSRLVTERSGVAVDLCYQCRKCTTGCPLAPEMDLQPSQVMRLVQLGQKQAVLESKSIWLCVGCETCGVRCPNDLDIPAVTDVLREMAVAEGVPAGETNAQIFHEVFLSSIRGGGRQWEAGMLAWYKAASLDLFSDLGVGAKMIAKGKIPLKPSRIRGVGQVRAIFNRTIGKQPSPLRHLAGSLRRTGKRGPAAGSDADQKTGGER